MLRGTGLSSSPSVVLGGISDILHYVSASPDAARWLAATLPQSMSKNILASTWYATGEPSMGNTSQDERTLGTGKMPPKPVIIGSLTFHPVPGGQLGTVDGIKRDIPVNTFLIAEKEISLTAWNEFLKANPEWEPANATDLLEKGLISENYLQEYSAPAYPKDAVSGISWFAAKAFCAWLQGQMPVQMQELTVDLPTEIQWQYAAELDSIGATGFEGGLWEWCSDYYVPHSFLPAASNSRVIGPERSIRGGSWINSPNSVRTSTRASLPPRICSPFVGFRPVIELVSGTIE
jgi:iron(II)-dependent oxidoreductase